MGSCVQCVCQPEPFQDDGEPEHHRSVHVPYSESEAGRIEVPYEF